MKQKEPAMNKIPAGYKKTEVGVIPEDWQINRVGYVCKLINGRGFKPFEWKTSGLPIIRIQNLNGSEEYNYFSGFYDKKLEIETGQLLFAWSGSRGTSFGPHVWKGRLGLLNYHTWKVHIHETVITRDFLLHSLRQLTTYIEGWAHGASALVHVQKWQMEDFLIPMPPNFAEQEAIATALNDADALITQLEKLIAKKRLIKQGAMQQLLTGKKRIPGFIDKWELKMISEIAPLKRGFDLPNRNLRLGSYPVIYSDGMLNHHITFKVKGPGVVTGRSGTIGTVTFVEKDFWPHNTSLWVTSFRGNDPKFVYYLYTRIGLERFATGSGVPTLNRNDVHSFKVKIPSNRDEQETIAQILIDLDAEIEALENKLAKYKQIKQGMMQSLLTGKVRLL